MTEGTLARKIADILYDKKAKDIVVLKVEHLTVLTDYLVIATGRSAIQVKALAEEVDDRLAEEGVALRRKEGQNEGCGMTAITAFFCPFSRKMHNLSQSIYTLWKM